MSETDPWLPADPSALLVADPARREPISFQSDGNRLAAHLYRPPRAARGEPTPGIVMTGPVSSVKEQTLPHYAERFADAGYTVLAFDPRFQYDPWLIVADYVNAAAYLMGRDDVDPLRSPRSVLIVHGTTDATLLPELAQAAYDAAVGPKELVWIETHNHIELYDQDPYVSEAARHVLGWLDRVLARSAEVKA